MPPPDRARAGPWTPPVGASWQSALRRHLPQAAFTFGVFLVFVAVASGKVELQLSLDMARSSLQTVAATREFAALVAAGLLMCFLLPLLSPIASSALTLLCTLPVVALGVSVQSPRPLIPMEFSLLTILVLYLLHVAVSYSRETQKKKQVIALFGQYVPPQLAQRLGRDPDAVAMEGEARELSVMFSDVRDFTTVSEQLDPRQLTHLLNALLTPLTEIVHKHQGTIDKYLGDGMMAFWGAPLPNPDHAGHALAAAFEMQEAVAVLREDFERRGWPRLELGIGLNTGVVNVGNMGSRYRMAYTAVGDAVNLAARLQELTRVFSSRTIVGESTRRAFPGAVYRELGLVEIKGKQELVRIYEPCHPALDPESTIVEGMHRHNAGLDRYYAREWDEAERLFRALQAANPADPLYDYYLARIAEYRRVPPPAGWRGEIRYTVG